MSQAYLCSLSASCSHSPHLYVIRVLTYHFLLQDLAACTSLYSRVIWGNGLGS